MTKKSPPPLYDFYPGTLLKRFSLFGENETANSACVKYYHSVKLLGWYLE